MTAENMGKVRNEATMVKSLPQTPLDALLAGYSRTQPKVNNPDRPLTGPLAEKECSMYLKLAQLAKGEKVLRIVDFIDKIVSTTDDKTISDLGSTKLLISSGPKKLKLESVTIAQWVVGNTEIFNHLLSCNKLASPQDVQHYLAYTVKIMESSKSLVGPQNSNMMTNFVTCRPCKIIHGALIRIISIQ